MSNENNGVLFKNKRKETERHPDYTGNAQIDGKDYWVSAGIKEAGQQAKNPGQKFLSLAFTEKDAPPRPAQTIADDFDDDIPF